MQLICPVFTRINWTFDTMLAPFLFSCSDWFYKYSVYFNLLNTSAHTILHFPVSYQIILLKYQLHINSAYISTNSKSKYEVF